MHDMILLHTHPMMTHHVLLLFFFFFLEAWTEAAETRRRNLTAQLATGSRLGHTGDTDTEP